MRAMIGAVVGATPRLPRAKSKGGRPRECEAMPLVYPQPRKRAGTLPRPYVGVALLALAACGPGSVAPPDDDNARGDDDAFADDDAGDDDAATGGTGTISVTVEVLAVLQEGQSVNAEIVLDGTPTGVFAPAEVETDSGPHTITLKTNEPGAPIPERFVAAPHDVSVSRDSTVACPMFIGRDLGGMWRLVEVGGEAWEDDPIAAEIPVTAPPDAAPCPTNLWVVLRGEGKRCLLSSDRLWWHKISPPFTVEGNILDSGTRIVYDYTVMSEGGPLPGPYVFIREE